MVIDCFEVIMETPSSHEGRVQSFSNYKNRNTVKYLIGITPQGSVSFISPAYGGRVSDKYITEDCGILDYLESEDILMADRGFTIQKAVESRWAELLIPAFTRGKKQLSPYEVQCTRKIASVRIHVERVIGNIREKFKILSYANRLPMDLVKSQNKSGVPLVDMICTVACALVNLCPSVVPMNLSLIHI